MTGVEAPSSPLGTILIGKGLLTQQQLDDALSEQLQSGSRLGDILVSKSIISMQTLYRMLAEHFRTRFVDLLAEQPDNALLRAADLNEYIQYRAVPWKREEGAITVATSEPDAQLATWAAAKFGNNWRFVITSPYDIRRTVERVFSTRLDEESRLHLYHMAPQHSARKTFQRDQQYALVGILALLAALAALYPQETFMWLVGILHVTYAMTMVFKWMVFSSGLRTPAKNYLQAAARPITDKELPVYTILVPLYKEAGSLPHLIASLKRLNYPASKLDVKLVLEADDEETISAAIALKPAWNFDIIRVPHSNPRTKPKACNYALRFARGAYVTIYDADDEPDPDQLRKAFAAFRNLPADVACVQSRLNYYNANDSLITRWFAIEYGILFDSLLPGLQALDIPIPLGGTSNHLSLARLRELGEWDPYNVTEDADLGVRLATRGQRTVVIDSVTMEEAPITLTPWLKQRSRWIKGYMQTWLVHMRSPIALLRNLGFVSFFGLQCFVGLACLTFLTAPIVWTLSLVSLSTAALYLPAWLVQLSLFNLFLHFVAHWHQALRTLPRLSGWKSGGKIGLLFAALTFPLYWILHSLASYRALWQLIFRPHHWDKTTHGLARRPEATESEAEKLLADKAARSATDA